MSELKPSHFSSENLLANGCVYVEGFFLVFCSKFPLFVVQSLFFWSFYSREGVYSAPKKSLDAIWKLEQTSIHAKHWHSLRKLSKKHTKFSPFAKGFFYLVKNWRMKIYCKKNHDFSSWFSCRHFWSKVLKTLNIYTTWWQHFLFYKIFCILKFSLHTTSKTIRKMANNNSSWSFNDLGDIWGQEIWDI